MDTSARRRIDFTFRFARNDWCNWLHGRETWKTECSEDMHADLKHCSGPPFSSERAPVIFGLSINDKIIDSTMVISSRKWLVAFSGSNLPGSYNPCWGPEAIYPMGPKCVMAGRFKKNFEIGGFQCVVAPEYYWLRRAKRITASVFIPEEVFIIPIDPSIVKFEKTPLEDVVLNDEATMDFTLVSTKDGEKVKCHRSALNVSGEFFQTLINDSLNPGSERSQAELPFSRKTLKTIKQYIYRRKVEFDPDMHMEEIVDAGTMLMFPGLVKQCEEHLIKELQNQDKWEMLVLARKFDMKKLKNKVFLLAADDLTFRSKIEKNEDYSLLVEYTQYLMNVMSQVNLCLSIESS